MTLDLNAIRKRAEAAKGNPLKDVSVIYRSNCVISEDVPALIAEVERLRQALWEITVYPSEDALEIAEEALEHGR